MTSSAPAPSTLPSSNSGPRPSRSILTQLLSTLNSLQPTGISQSTTESEDIIFAHPAQSHIHLGPNSGGGQLYHLSRENTVKARSVFLTLHVLFPHHLLPALDLLDRGLVTRFLIPTPGQVHRNEDEGGLMLATATNRTNAMASEAPSPSLSPASARGWEVYYIQSSSAVTTKSNPRRKKQSISATFYEVRLDAWNCSCPAFSVDAFQGMMNPHDEIDGAGIPKAGEQPEQLGRFPLAEDVGWRVGGTATLPSSAGRTPVCKHILAAVLARAAPNLFGAGVAESEGSREQLAGWGGGWGVFGYG